MLDRVYHVTAQGVLDLVMVQVQLVVIDEGHAHTVGSREIYITQPEGDSQSQDLTVIATALWRIAEELDA
jgi:hypothetical protein